MKSIQQKLLASFLCLTAAAALICGGLGIAANYLNTYSTLERDLEASLQTPDSRAAIQIFVTRAVQKRTALRLLLDSHRRPELERLLIRALRTYLRELFRRRYPRSALSAADLAAALDFYACGIIGVLLGSCRQPNPDPEALTDQICRLLSGEMLRQLS